MKKTVLLLFGGLLTSIFSYGQKPDATDLLKELGKLTDQHGNLFDPDVTETSTLIFVEGTNTSFSEIYSKFRGKDLIDNVRVVAGWKNVMPDSDNDYKLKHRTEGFRSPEGLGKDGYSVLFDLDNKSHQLLGLKRYSVVTVSREENRVEVEDFGSDRVEFLKTIRKSFK